MTTITETLRRLAEKAPKGPWKYRPQEHDDWGFVRGLSGGLIAACRAGYPYSEDELATHRKARTDPYGHVAQLIARCDPQTILALVAVVEAAREMRDAERNHAAFAVIIQATRDLDAALEALAGVEG